MPQQNHGQWDHAGRQSGEYANYGDQYQGAQYPADAYGQQYQADPYQGGQYDPYAYGGQHQNPSYDQQGYDQTGYDQAYPQGYGAPYDPAQQHHPHGTGSERPDGSQQ
ncbi:putative Metacaspase-1A [Streptomyces afghaniensis 772]|uniref:Putative Metacaspase-1A n=1 Tax=Streptomyces afghaniensis 772 TaxID=1283301 RepID=S4NCB3_9ACTN|nr:putative Metacaspase-1A [Streptomyces afghaniensis 772]